MADVSALSPEMQNVLAHSGEPSMPALVAAAALSGTLGTAGLGAALGGAGGSIAGHTRGNTAEGLGRGILRGAATGLGAGLGGVTTGLLGAGLRSAGVPISGSMIAPGMVGGGALGYMLGGQALGEPVGAGTPPEEQHTRGTKVAAAAGNVLGRGLRQILGRGMGATGRAVGRFAAKYPRLTGYGTGAFAALPVVAAADRVLPPDPATGSRLTDPLMQLLGFQQAGE